VGMMKLSSIRVYENFKDILLIHLSTYLKMKRNEFRKSEKKQGLDLYVIINFINSYISKLQKIIYSIRLLDNDDYHISNNNDKKLKIYGYSNLLNLGITELCKKIISDNTIIRLIEVNISEKYNYASFYEFSRLMKTLSNYYDKNYEWFKNLIGKTLKYLIPESSEYSFLNIDKSNLNFSDLYIFSDIYYFYKSCVKKFNFVGDKNIYDDIYHKLNFYTNKIINGINKNKDYSDLNMLDRYHNFICNFINEYSYAIKIYLDYKKDNIYNLAGIIYTYKINNIRNLNNLLNYYLCIAELVDMNNDKMYIF
jgi:hypothetical protein